MRRSPAVPAAMIAVVLATTSTACGGADDPDVPEELVGTYEADLPASAGALAITIGADRSFVIERPGHRPFGTGPITVDDGKIVLSPDEFGDCAKNGTYAYRIDDGNLTLSSVHEPCEFRAKDLDRTWVPRSAVSTEDAAERRALERYRLQRNAICRKWTSEAEAINASASSVGEGVALRRVAVVMRNTQADLDELEVPARFSAFVDQDRKLRAERIRLDGRLADALEENSGDAGPIGQELVGGNVVPTEAAEDRYFLTHCP